MGGDCRAVVKSGVETTMRVFTETLRGSHAEAARFEDLRLDCESVWKS